MLPPPLPQTVLSGMGELHLEVVHDRLRREHRLDCSLGQLQVAYRETPTTSVSQEGECTGLGVACCIIVSEATTPFAIDRKWVWFVRLWLCVLFML